MTYRKSSAGLQVESASFGGGVIRPGDSNSGQGEVDYFLTDHLGSVRVIVDGTGKVLERNDYYPFGARQVRSDYSQLAANRFKYNGKEVQVTGDLRYLDYGARMYDSGLGRWFGVDPKTEENCNITPYSYVFNNPLLLIDPNGELPALAITIGGATVMIAAMDMVLIGLGIVSAGVVLKQAFDKAGIAYTEEMDFFWNNTLNMMATIYADQYLTDIEKQRRREQKGKNDFDQNLANMINSINNNYGGPTPDGNADPKRDLTPKERIVWGAIFTITAIYSIQDGQSLDNVEMSKNEKSKKQDNENVFSFLWHWLKKASNDE